MKLLVASLFFVVGMIGYHELDGRLNLACGYCYNVQPQETVEIACGYCYRNDKVVREEA